MRYANAKDENVQHLIKRQKIRRILDLAMQLQECEIENDSNHWRRFKIHHCIPL